MIVSSEVSEAEITSRNGKRQMAESRRMKA
jgi:hypothetical protein